MCDFTVLNPRQWSLAEESNIKDWKWCLEMPEKVEAKRDGVINPQNYNFTHFFTRKILMHSKRMNVLTDLPNFRMLKVVLK